MGQAGNDECIEAWDFGPEVLKAMHDPTEIIGPYRRTLCLRTAHIENCALRIACGGDPRLTCPVRSCGDEHGAFDGEGQDETVAVVDVLADQVHAAGSGGENGRILAE